MPFTIHPGWAQPCPRTGGVPYACGHYSHTAADRGRSPALATAAPLGPTAKVIRLGRSRVMPHPSSMTSPLPRVAARPLPFANTGLRLVPEAFCARPDCPATLGFAAVRGAGCGDLEDRSWRLRHETLPLPALMQVRGLTAPTVPVGGTGFEPVTCLVPSAHEDGCGRINLFGIAN
jgi:hypothetical protein